MKQHHAIFAGLLAIGIASAGPAMGQVLPYPPAGLPSQEVVALVRSTGLEPVTRPVRHGPAYVLNAVNPSGREVRVVVDAHQGRVVRVVPLGPARQAVQPVQTLPAPYGRPPADLAVPDGNGPTARVAGLPPDVDEAEPYGRVAAVGAIPVAPPARAPAAATNRAGPTPHTGPTTSQTNPPPLPRPRPKLAAAESITPPAAAPPAVAAPVTAPAETVTTATGNSPSVTANGPSATAAAVPPEPVYEQHE